MNVLVTGASGFLGRHVVAALRKGGHRVRVLFRLRGDSGPPVHVEPGLEAFPADLRAHRDLGAAFEGMDALIHLAAAMQGSDFHRFSETVVGTERLLEAMARSPVKRLVLCSSFMVYDWLRARGTVDEGLTQLRDVYSCGGYAAAKLWQERLARRLAERSGWQLTILRPAFIWGPGRPCPDGSVGRRLGSFRVVFSPRRQPPLTHVANCADCFRTALEDRRTIGQTLNVVDDFGVSAWRFARDQRDPGLAVPLPFWLAWPLIRGAHAVGRRIFGRRARLPSVVLPARAALACKPVRCDTRRLRAFWQPPYSYEECLAQTFQPST